MLFSIFTSSDIYSRFYMYGYIFIYRIVSFLLFMLIIDLLLLVTMLISQCQTKNLITLVYGGD